MPRPTILLVDDVPENIDVLNGILKDRYKIKVALNGTKALEIAKAGIPPDLILLDIMMPGMDGYEVCRRLKSDFATRRIPVIFVTAMDDIDDEARGFELGAVDYITKPVSPAIVQARVETQLALYDRSRMLENRVRQRTAELNESRLQIIQRLGRAAEYKDNETGLHVVRMSHYSKLIGLAAGMSEDEAELLLNAAPMHDIGKIGIPDRILQKSGELDVADWEIMRRHPEIGAEILGEHSSELLNLARQVALTHHEMWNGQGYPEGLKGEEIPLAGRIVTLADVFDALTTERPYKKAWTVEKTLEFIQKKSGVIFDPWLVEVFLGIVPQILEIKERYREEVPAE
ncbi:MAG: two-component system response regulator [Methylococcaceae bacterium]|nr:two-component system response regulator [Methylococcaceae bacterium]